MLNGIYYLNNTGHKWIVFEQGQKQKITLFTKSGIKVVRTVIYYESFGNFATALISYKGKKMSVFPDTILED
jgi:hypothetical protein